MRTYIKKNTIFDLEEYFKTQCGWGNGYVILDKGHPWFGMPYEDIPVSIHGGLTYGQHLTEKDIKEWDTNLSESDVGKYMIGFDTWHYGDTSERWTKEEVQKEANRLLYQCVNAINNNINI